MLASSADLEGYGPGNGNVGQVKWRGEARVKGPKKLKMPLTTVGLLGLQIVWSLQMAYSSPYLLSLGMSKSLMSLVAFAGPLSGLVVQPLIGLLSDRSTSRFGRRTFYLIVGSAISVIGMQMLGFTRQVASLFVGSSNDSLTKFLAVLAVYLIDFSINAVQSADRALVVDVLPESEQILGNAWAGRMSAMGACAGFFIGNINLVNLFPFLGQTQLQVLTVLASLLLVGTHSITVFAVREKVLVYDPRPRTGNIFRAILNIYRETLALPSTIRRVCNIIFFMSLASFPVHFFSTVWLGEIYIKSHSNTLTDPAIINQEASRVGSRAMFYAAALSFLSSVVSPILVGGVDNAEQLHGWRRWAKLDIVQLWAIANVFFGVCLLTMFFTRTVHIATIAIALTGVTWAIGGWAPYTLVGEVIRRESNEQTVNGDAAESIPLVYARVSTADVDESSLASELDAGESEGATIPHAPGHATAELHSNHSIANKSGVILGILNTFIVIPQFLVTGLASLVFALFEPGRTVFHDSGPVVPGSPTASSKRSGTTLELLFLLGSVCALTGGIMAWRLARDLKRT